MRPTSDRVKEALFNILGPSVVDALFIDLCCGAGGLSVEALSRGAARAVLVDSAPASLRLAAGNLAACDADPSTYDLVRGDAVRWLAAWRAPAGVDWIAVADPPYRSEQAGRIMELLADRRHEPGFVRAMVEYGADAPPAGAGAPWRERRYGGTVVADLAPPEERTEA